MIYFVAFDEDGQTKATIVEAAWVKNRPAMAPEQDFRSIRFDSIDVSLIAVLNEDHDRIVAAKDTQIAALERRPCVFAVAFITNDAGQVLLIHNRNRDGWELPGGSVEPNEDPRVAAKREAIEEAGVEPTLDPLPCAVLLGHVGVALVYRGRAEGEPVAGDDADKAAWADAECVMGVHLSDIPSKAVLVEWVRTNVPPWKFRLRLDDPIVRRPR